MEYDYQSRYQSSFKKPAFKTKTKIEQNYFSLVYSNAYQF